MTDYYTCRECNGYTLHCGCYEARQATVKQTLTIQPVSNSYKFDPDAFSQWIDDGCPEGVSGMPEAANFLLTAWNTRATDAENQRLMAEVEALREDCRKLLENEPVATCESCGAWLLDGDDYVTDPDGVAGCWASMTDVPSKTERKCYAYRVDKCDARQHLSDNAEAIAPGE